jgi:ribulose-5-phosphate 4-epimerase/fuculose-1-phosphate aldolase
VSADTSTTDSAASEQPTGVHLFDQTNPLGPAIPELTPRQELALLARILHREGYDDHLAGHITYLQPDGTLLTNPFGLMWDELRACDVMRLTVDGHVLDGPWTVTPAIELHLAIHEQRDDVTVAVHNHPSWGTVWADARRVPPVYDQTSAQVADDLVLYDSYDGNVADKDAARKAAGGLGDARFALLANHGVLVVGKDIQQAHHRAIFLEWRCRMAWRVEQIGGGFPLPDEFVQEFGGIFDHVPFPHLWEAEVRRELRRDPSVLDESL